VLWFLKQDFFDKKYSLRSEIEDVLPL
jgi:hypothetical protein